MTEAFVRNVLEEIRTGDIQLSILEVFFTALSWIVTVLILYVLGFIAWHIGIGFLKGIFKR
jgi:hypothetical protein